MMETAAVLPNKSGIHRDPSLFCGHGGSFFQAI